MAIWHVLTPGGAVSAKTFTSRGAARAYVQAHPGYKSPEYAPRKERGLAAGKTLAEARGHGVPAPKPGVFRRKSVFGNGRKLSSVREMFNFLALSEAPCVYVAFLVGGEKRPVSPNAPTDGGTTTPVAFSKSAPVRWVPGTQRGESKSIETSYLLNVVLMESNLLGVISNLRPDVSFMEGAAVYGWQIQEGEC